MYYFVSLVLFYKPVALLSHPCRLPVAFLAQKKTLPLSCRSPVALLSLSPAAFLSLPCRHQPCCPPVVLLWLSQSSSCRYVLFPVASLSPPCRQPVAPLSPSCCPPVAAPLLPSYRLPVASCRFPAAFLPLSCRLHVATLSSSCRHPVAFLSLPAACCRRLPRVARIY